MDPITEKLQERAEVVTEAEEILNQAKKENRDLSDKEEQEYNQLRDKAANLNREIRELKLDIEKNKNQITREMEGEQLEGELRVFKPGQDFRSKTAQKRTTGKRLDTGKYLRGIITGNWEGAEEERAQAKGTGSAGGYLVPTQLSDRLINKARAKNTVTQAGAGTIELPNGNMSLAKVASHPGVEIKAENEAATEQNITFERENMELHTLFAMATISQELLQDGKNIGQIVEKELSDSIASQLDYLAYLGTGSSEPLGIINNPDVNKYSLGTDGSTLSDYTPWSHAVQAVRNSNVEPTATVYNARTAGSLDRLTASNGQPLQAPDSYKNLNKYVTNQIPNDFTQGTNNNASVSVVGKFDNLLIGLHSTGMQVRATDTGSGALEKYQYKIAVALRADILATVPKEFTVIEGILPDA